MIDVLVKTLIPILLLTVVELVFFFNIAVKDINNDFNSKIGGIIELFFKTDVSKKINIYMIEMIERINERTLICSERDRKRYNSVLLFRGVFLVFMLLLAIFLLIPKLEDANFNWWMSTLIESVILLVLLAYFQFKFLNEIIKSPDYVYFTNEEIKLGIVNNVSKIKVPSLWKKILKIQYKGWNYKNCLILWQIQVKYY